MQLPDLSRCFGCGKDNPRGLGLTNRQQDGKAVMELLVEDDLCGFPGVLHGGIISTVLDEVMCYAIFGHQMAAVTLSVTIEYKRPAKVGQHLRAEAWVEKVEGKYIECSGELTDTASDVCIAKASGRFKIVDFDRFLNGS